MASLMMLVGVFALCLHRENNTCMNVPILQDADYAKLTQYEYIDLSQWLYQNEEPAAIDTKTSTIYISQNVWEGTGLGELAGVLELRLPGYALSFAPDEMFSDMASAMAQGHCFRLLAVKDETRYMAYDVIFTALPVMKIDGSETAEVDKEGRTVFSGNMCLWSAKDPEVDRYTVKSSPVKWHIRGATSARMAKKSWKLSLREENGENHNLSFLNMGSDDDWILNSMSLDDSRVREKTSTDMWNQYICENHSGYRMSSAAYVEVVMNGQYQGLYLLQRRIDDKYLSLDQSRDVLFKCLATYEDLGLRVNYEINFSPYDEDSTYRLLENTLNNREECQIDLDSFMDTVLFIQYYGLFDNQGYKNMYYVLRAENRDNYKMFFVPWDTDMSMGLTWTDFFEYDYEGTLTTLCKRRENDAVQLVYPELDGLIAERWQKLRTSALANDTALALLDKNIGMIQDSGALDRDIQRWGLNYGGKDTHEAMYQWCRERWQYLDGIYGK